jgi:hypothetical protein
VKKPSTAVKTTGQLRTMLAEAIEEVAAGTMDLNRAIALHKLSKNIAESMYSETKIAMFRHELAAPQDAFGALPLGDPS